MKVDLSGKTAVIWGAVGSIGQKIAERLADCGANLALCDSDSEKVGKKAETLRIKGYRAAGFTIGQGSVDSVQKVMKEIEDLYGGPDILINVSTGMSDPENRSPVTEFSRVEWANKVGGELGMVYYLSKAVIPYMQKKGGGCIVNVTSSAGLVAMQGQCAASAVHAGIISFSKAIAIELALKGIRVNAVVHGFISDGDGEEGFYGNQASEELILQFIPQKRAGRPENVATAVLCLTDEEMGYITGAVMNVDGGWSCGYARNF